MIGEAIETIDKLIKIDTQNPSHYLKKINLTSSITEKQQLINKLIELNPYHEEFYNKKCDLLIERYNENAFDSEEKSQEIISLFKKSLELNPSIDNAAWVNKFNFYNKLPLKKSKKELELIIESLSLQKPYYSLVLNMQLNLVKKEKKVTKEFIKKINDCKEIYLSENKINYELLILDTLNELNDTKELKLRLTELSKNLMYNEDVKFLNKKALIYAMKFSRFSESIKIYQNSIKIKPTQIAVNQIIFIALGLEKIDTAKEVFKKYKYLFKPEDVLKLEIDFHLYKKEYDKALDKFREFNKFELDPISKVSSESYYLMLNNQWKDANILLKKFLEEHNYSPNLIPETINYELTLKKLNSNISKKRLDAIKKDNNNLELAAIASLLDDKTSVYKYLSKELEKDSSKRFVFKIWPVFSTLQKEKRFQEFYEFEEVD